MQIVDDGHRAEIIELFDLVFAPTTSAFDLSGDGRWTRRTHDDEGSILADYQSELIRRHRKRRRIGDET